MPAASMPRCGPSRRSGGTPFARAKCPRQQARQAYTGLGQLLTRDRQCLVVVCFRQIEIARNIVGVRGQPMRFHYPAERGAAREGPNVLILQPCFGLPDVLAPIVGCAVEHGKIHT